MACAACYTGGRRMLPRGVRRHEPAFLSAKQTDRRIAALGGAVRWRRGTNSRMIADPTPVQPAQSGGQATARAAVHVSGLRKRYGDVAAVDGIDLTVRAGEFFTL